MVVEKQALVGFDNFKRGDVKTDKFEVLGFHHIEWICGDTANVAQRFSVGLGMNIIAKSDLSTKNSDYSSWVLRSGDLTYVMSSPYGVDYPGKPENSNKPIPSWSAEKANTFFNNHGLGVRFIGLSVSDAKVAFSVATESGLEPHTEPFETSDDNGFVVISEVIMYDDTVIRFVQAQNYKGRFLPAYNDYDSPYPVDYGLKRLDHCVSNVPEILPLFNKIAKATGFHEFAEFVAADVGTVDSGLNSIVMSNNNSMVLLPINEPTFGTNRKSQIQTYLEFYKGSGVQHLALKSDNIFETLRKMRQAGQFGGFEFMPAPKGDYYEKHVPEKLGEDINQVDIKSCKELDILVDKDDQGILLQIFTKPLGDRPTVFIEIIQRIGCMVPETGEQAGGCGGFGKGNFGVLFGQIEANEKKMGI